MGMSSRAQRESCHAQLACRLLMPQALVGIFASLLAAPVICVVLEAIVYCLYASDGQVALPLARGVPRGECHI